MFGCNTFGIHLQIVLYPNSSYNEHLIKKFQCTISCTEYISCISCYCLSNTWPLTSRYHFLVKYHTKYKVIFEKPILERYEMEEEVKIREEKKRLGAELLEHIHKITELIVAIHIITCADYLSINRLRIERTNQGNFCVL